MQFPESKSQLDHLVAMQSWERHLTFVCLTYKIRVIVMKKMEILKIK